MKKILPLFVILFCFSSVLAQDAYQSARKIVVGVSNAGATGTTVNRLAKLTGAPSTAVVAATTDTDGVIGVVTGGAGTAGVATVQTAGLVGSSASGGCDFDGATTAGDYVQVSSTTAGKCHDTGAGTYPTSGQVIGRVLSTNAGAGTYQILLTPGVKAAGGATPAGASGDLQTNNGSGGLGSTPQSTFLMSANSLSELANAGTARTNLGLGTAATQNTGTSGANVPLLSGANTWSSAQTFSATVSSPTYVSTTVALTDGATITWDLSAGQYSSVTLGGNRTLSISNGADGRSGCLKVKQDATGSRTLALPAGSKVINGGAGAITLTTTANAEDILCVHYFSSVPYFNLGLNFN